MLETAVLLDLGIILAAKVIEVTLSTLRTVFVSRGEKAYAASIGFVEVMIWLKVASVVLVGINEHPEKMLVYALGFSIGSIIGLTIEEKLGLGYSNVEVITSPQEGALLADAIRELGKAVTVVNGKGRDEDRVILSTYVKRRNQDSVVSKVKELNIQGMVTVTTTQKVYGGFGLK